MNVTCTRNLAALTIAAGLSAILAAQTPAAPAAAVENALARAAERVEEYIARVQRIVLSERVMIQNVTTDLTPLGFARILESDLRLELDTADGPDELAEPKVIRELKRVNGHAPRKKDDQDCLDPNPISAEPLSFLLPAQRGKYAFTWVGPGKGKERNTLIMDFRELGSGKPEVKERDDKAEGCFSIEMPGRGLGRVWLDGMTFEVLRVDQRINGRVDFRMPDSKKRRRIGFPDFQVIERLDTSIRYKTFSFSDPEEMMLLPESIDTLLVARGVQSYRMRQIFSNYRRFVTGGRLVK
jgi:hypothetical protein